MATTKDTTTRTIVAYKHTASGIWGIAILWNAHNGYLPDGEAEVLDPSGRMHHTYEYKVLFANQTPEQCKRRGFGPALNL